MRGDDVISNADDLLALTPTKRAEFEALLEEFRIDYAETDRGAQHLSKYEPGREAGRRHFREAVEARKRGDDVTDQVLYRLTPQSDTSPSRERGGWIHVAPTMAGDIKAFFEGKNMVTPEEWPKVAEMLLAFIERCNDHPDELAEACEQLVAQPLAKGFQAGTLSPILNALHPDRFLIFNSKPRQVIHYLTGANVQAKMSSYSEANRRGWELIGALPGLEAIAEAHGVTKGDVFDTFCHWLVAEKKFDFKDPQCWKIAPEEQARLWEECRTGGYISMGWSELGDIGDLNKGEFRERQDRLVQERNWTKTATNQVWKLAHQVREGDYIVANRGTSEVLGLGEVTGPYHFVPDAEHGHAHRVPVKWYDTTPRSVNKPGWRRTLIKLDRAEFEEIAESAPTSASTADGDAGEAENREPDTPGDVHAEGPFSARTFELLVGLHESPTRSYYSEHKGEFERHVIEPFKALMLAVGKQLPPPAQRAMETEHRIFARILKNDWGRGGAWDFYWGAFYPRGGKRIESAQLFLSLNRLGLAAGFSLGQYSSAQARRFQANVGTHREALRSALSEIRRDADLRFGKDSVATREDPRAPRTIDFDDWLREPVPDDIDVTLPLTRKTVLTSSFDELRDRIADTLSRLFPFVLLATSDAPIADVAEYLGSEDEREENPEFTLEDCAAELHLDVPVVAQWVRALDRKGQAVLYGPPGTGKTYVARRIARHLVGGTDGSVDLVQFHSAYAYEDFMQGIRPQSEAGGGLSYPLVPGRFLEFCREAERRDGPCVLIIDEINRANLARVFGELMYLLEYRTEDVPLAGGRRFRIPENVRLIGTMNTADRSIALVDHALRRRFAFIPLFPQYDVLRRYHAETGFPVEQLVGLLEQLNADIVDANYAIGISFFLHSDLSEHLEDIWRMEIEPYLEEYFFDQEDRVKRYRWDQIKERLQT